MKIVVTVKQVAALADDFEISNGRIEERYLEYEINEWDDYALEAALQIRESREDIEVVVVTIGPERVEETIRMTLAKGADRAIRIWDEALEEISHQSVATTARMLDAVIQTEDPDLVLTGVQSGDDANGATGVTLAQEIGFEWAAVINDLELDESSENATIRRELEGGVEEIATISLPAVLTIQTGINEPRYASLRGIRQAQQKQLDVQSLAGLDLDEQVLESTVTRREMFEPETESEAAIWEGTADETAAQLASLLREKGVGGS